MKNVDLVAGIKKNTTKKHKLDPSMKIGYDLHFNDNITYEYEGIFFLV